MKDAETFKAIFLFTLTPVQGFIASTRKTQDLYNASLILSYLCEVGMKALKSLCAQDRDEAGALAFVRILFPSEKVASKPNRFMAEVEGSEETLRRAGRFVEERVRAEWLAIGTEAADKLELLSREHAKQRELFKEQLQRYFQIHWLFFPYSGQAETFEEEYRRAEQHFAALKNLRAFAPIRPPEAGRKCAMTGEENVLFYRPSQKDAVPYLVRQTEPTPVAVHHVNLHYLAEGEALGGVGMVKRVAGEYLRKKIPDYEEGFPSTAHVALYPLKEELDSALREEGLSEKDLEPQYLFALNEGRPFTEDQATERVYRNVFSRLKRRMGLKPKEPLPLVPYYALMVFDGDRMGDWFAGRFKPAHMPLPRFHDLLSNNLGEYAAWVRKYLQPPKGKVVYAGGDDLLAFLALDRVFETAQELRTEFAKQVNLEEVTAERLTFSAGLVIAHYKDPLSHVLETARRVEKEAKESGRNALGVAVLKRSGEAVEAVLAWEDGQGGGLGGAIAKVDAHWRQKRFSTRWVRAFAGWMASILGAAETGGSMEDHALQEMAWIELARVARRAAQTNNRDTREAWVQALVEDLRVLHRFCRGKKKASSGDATRGGDWRTFIDLLNILVFLKEKWDDGHD